MNKQRFLYGYIALAYLAMFVYGSSLQAIGTLITRIIAHYNISMAQAGLLPSFVSLGCMAAVFTMAIFVGRINKMILMCASILFLSVSLFLISVAPPFGIILICFALVGIFSATMDMLINSLIADLMPDKVSLGISLLHGMFGLGGLSGPIIFDRLAENLSWTQVYFTLSIIFLFYLIIFSVFVKWQWGLLATRLSNKTQARIGFSDIVLFLKRKRQILLLLTVFFYGGNQFTMVVWIKRYVETHLNEPDLGAYALSVLWLGIALSRLVVSPGIKAPSSLKICIGNFVSVIALIGGLLSGSALGTVIASFVIGLSSGFTIPLVIALGCEWNKENTALGTMVPFLSLFTSNMVFPPLSGLISDMFGIPWGLVLAAVCAVITAALSGILDKNLKSEEM